MNKTQDAIAQHLAHAKPEKPKGYGLPKLSVDSTTYTAKIWILAL